MSFGRFKYSKSSHLFDEFAILGTVGKSQLFVAGVEKASRTAVALNGQRVLATSKPKVSSFLLVVANAQAIRKSLVGEDRIRFTGLRVGVS